MRILFSSNSPSVATGYGQQCAITCRHLKDMGHEVAIFAFYGLQGSLVDWGDIPLYPNDAQDWGVKNSSTFYDDFKADLFMTLVDVWVQGGLNPKMNWVPWLPIDHDPPPDLVIKVLKESPGLVKPIAMSKFGLEQLKKNGIEAYYIPHSIDTELYKPLLEDRKIARGKYGWEDKFVIGTVGTNHTERKNWVAGMKAVALFAKKHPGEVIYYMHTNPYDQRGINLMKLKEVLGLAEICKFPSQAEMLVGIPMDTMAKIYNVLDVFLLPSKGEGFGIPLIESQACGTPVITTNCTAQPELVGGGWLIKKLIPEWTGQASWQFNCHPEEIVECLEKAYQAKKKGYMVDIQAKARAKALEYSDKKVFAEYWPPVLEDIEKRIKAPKNLEGVQNWRLAFIPPICMPRKVLDLGSGLTTPYKRYLEPLGEYVAIDNRVNGQSGIMKADAHNLPFKDGEFGFLWCSEMLEHVDNPERVLAEAKRVAKHGVILFSTPQNSFFKLDPEHKIIKGIDYQTVATGDGLLSW